MIHLLSIVLWLGWWFIASVIGAIYAGEPNGSADPNNIPLIITFVVAVIPLVLLLVRRFWISHQDSTPLFSGISDIVWFFLPFVIPPLLNITIGKW